MTDDTQLDPTRVARAVALRIAGVPFDKIAKECGIGSAGLARDVVRAALTAASGFDPGAEIITNLARLDRLLAGIWFDAAGGDEGKARLAVKIIDQSVGLLRLAEETGAAGKGRVTPLDELNARRAAAGRGANTTHTGRATVADY